jgi:hypothetical protein
MDAEVLQISDVGSPQHVKRLEGYCQARSGRRIRVTCSSYKEAPPFTDMGDHVNINNDRPVGSKDPREVALVMHAHTRHEMCHQDYTDPVVFREFIKEIERIGREVGLVTAQQIKDIWNALEDGMIEERERTENPRSYQFISALNRIDPRVGGFQITEQDGHTVCPPGYTPVIDGKTLDVEDYLDEDGNPILDKDGNPIRLVIIPKGTRVHAWGKKPLSLTSQAMAAVHASAIPEFEPGELHPTVARALKECQPHIDAAVRGNTADCVTRALKIRDILAKHGIADPETMDPDRQKEISDMVRQALEGMMQMPSAPQVLKQGKGSQGQPQLNPMSPGQTPKMGSGLQVVVQIPMPGPPQPGQEAQPGGQPQPGQQGEGQPQPGPQGEGQSQPGADGQDDSSEAQQGAQPQGGSQSRQGGGGAQQAPKCPVCGMSHAGDHEHHQDQESQAGSDAAGSDGQGEKAGGSEAGSDGSDAGGSESGGSESGSAGSEAGGADSKGGESGDGSGSEAGGSEAGGGTESAGSEAGAGSKDDGGTEGKGDKAGDGAEEAGAAGSEAGGAGSESGGSEAGGDAGSDEQGDESGGSADGAGSEKGGSEAGDGGSEPGSEGAGAGSEKGGSEAGGAGDDGTGSEAGSASSEAGGSDGAGGSEAGGSDGAGGSEAGGSDGAGGSEAGGAEGSEGSGDGSEKGSGSEAGGSDGAGSEGSGDGSEKGSGSEAGGSDGAGSEGSGDGSEKGSGSEGGGAGDDGTGSEAGSAASEVGSGSDGAGGEGSDGSEPGGSDGGSEGSSGQGQSGSGSDAAGSDGQGEKAGGSEAGSDGSDAGGSESGGSEMGASSGGGSQSGGGQPQGLPGSEGQMPSAGEDSSQNQPRSGGQIGAPGGFGGPGGYDPDRIEAAQALPEGQREANDSSGQGHVAKEDLSKLLEEAGKELKGDKVETKRQAHEAETQAARKGRFEGSSWDMPDDSTVIDQKELKAATRSYGGADIAPGSHTYGRQLAQELKNLLAEARRSDTGKRRGRRIDPRRYSSALAGRQDVMENPGIKQDQKARLDVVVDRSYSVHEVRANNVGQQDMTMMFGHMDKESRGKVPTSIYGYDGMAGGRVGHYAYKEAHSQDLSAIPSLLGTGGGGTPTAEAVEFSRARLGRSKEKIKIMAVITDGGANRIPETAAQVQAARAEGITVVGLAFECDPGQMDQQFGKGNWIAINDYKKAPRIVGQLISGAVGRTKRGH